MFRTRTYRQHVACQILFVAAILAIVVTGILPDASAQDPNCAVTQTVYDKKPVTISQWVTETVLTKQEVKESKPIYRTEMRQRTRTVLKPVVTTSEREEQYIVTRPVRETKYRERTIEETTLEELTEMRTERFTVEKPVIETFMRDQQRTVRRPVTERRYQTEDVTTYRPVTQSTTQLVPFGTMKVPQTVTRGRRGLRWMPRGYYQDPVNGGVTFRPAGFHWVTPEQCVVCTDVEVLAAQKVNTTTLVPEKIRVSKPVDVTRYIDEVETYKVPVQVQSTRKEVQTREVPVTVYRPKTNVRIERVPFEEVKFKEFVMTRKVPVTKTEYKSVEIVEDYEVQVPSWETVTREIVVPKTITRRIDTPGTQYTPRTVVARPTYQSTASGGQSVGVGSTLNRGWSNSGGRAIQETSGRRAYDGLPVIKRRVLSERVVDGPLPSTSSDSAQISNSPAASTVVETAKPATADGEVIGRVILRPDGSREVEFFNEQSEAKNDATKAARETNAKTSTNEGLKSIIVPETDAMSSVDDTAKMIPVAKRSRYAIPSGDLPSRNLLSLDDEPVESESATTETSGKVEAAETAPELDEKPVVDADEISETIEIESPAKAELPPVEPQQSGDDAAEKRPVETDGEDGPAIQSPASDDPGDIIDK